MKGVPASLNAAASTSTVVVMVRVSRIFSSVASQHGRFPTARNSRANSYIAVIHHYTNTLPPADFALSTELFHPGKRRSPPLTGRTNRRTIGPSRSPGVALTDLSNRQTEILNIARGQGRVMVEDLARRFEVSAQTIRKDLNDLCDHHVLTRIHGGAIIASGVENLAYEARRFVAAEEKKAIGTAAASLIPNGCSLFINIGTTTEEVASALTSHEDLLVITNNLNVAMLLYRYPRIEVIVAGGAVRRADGAVIGSTATSLIGQFKVDYAIIGASAIDEDGTLLDFDYREVQAAQAIISNARSVMLVADSTKFRRSAPVRIADISQINTFVTDVALPARLAEICRTREIQVIEALPGSLDTEESDTELPPAVTSVR
jgi:DeoR family glycerol-3-phosphate regulon repressor